jgi:ribonuclease P protein subunit POP4
MPLTPETLPRHELAGLHVEVVESTDPSRVGIAGRVVAETTRTLRVERDSGVATVPKRGTRFAFRLERSTDEAAGSRERPGIASELPPETVGTASASPDQSDGCEGATYVTVDGDVLLSRPARRSEQGVDTTWR